MVSDIGPARGSHADMTPDDMAEAVKKVDRALNWVQTQKERSPRCREHYSRSGTGMPPRRTARCAE
jgi:hypothetical protein